MERLDAVWWCYAENYLALFSILKNFIAYPAPLSLFQFRQNVIVGGSPANFIEIRPAFLRSDRNTDGTEQKPGRTR